MREEQQVRAVVELLVEDVLACGLDASLLDGLDSRPDDEVAACLDALAFRVARAFDDGELDYSPGDAVMNQAWTYCVVSDLIARRPQPPFMYAVFEAFDLGEFYHPGDSSSVDPVEKYTRPLIREALDGVSAKDRVNDHPIL